MIRIARIRAAVFDDNTNGAFFFLGWIIGVVYKKPLENTQYKINNV